MINGPVLRKFGFDAKSRVPNLRYLVDEVSNGRN